MKWRTTKSAVYQDMVTRHMKLDAAQTMKVIEVDKDGNAPMQHYLELEEDLLEDAERYKVSPEQEPHNRRLTPLVPPQPPSRNSTTKRQQLSSTSPHNQPSLSR